MSKLNIELFKKVRDRIATIPESYSQQTYYAPSRRAPCGTVCCIAGEAIICNAPSVEEGVVALRGSGSETATIAARLLGLVEEGEDYFNLGYDHPARRLFNEAPHESWPEPFRTQWLKARETDEPQIAVAYLSHIIDTGKVLD